MCRVSQFAQQPVAGKKAGRAQGRNAKAAALKATEQDVVVAVESLYADELRPHGRILLKRLGEHYSTRTGPPTRGRAALIALPCGGGGDCGRGGAGAELVPRIDTAHLRRVCEGSARLRVVVEGAEYCALLAGRPGRFVDASSNADPFPEGLWSTAARHFAGCGATTVLPGARYACARALMAAELPFLAGRSLGEVCHFVQLAISQRQILGFFDGSIVPYERSESVVKQQCASLQQPAWALQKGTMPVADLAQARACLTAMLEQSAREGSGIMPLPNVKRLFRSRFQLELSETALGHSRLCDLLQDERFGDICTLRLQGNHYVVVQTAPPQFSAAGPSRDSGATREDVSSASRHAALDESPVLNTFIHFPPAPPTPQAGAKRRSHSVPKNCGALLSASAAGDSSADNGESDVKLGFCPDEPLDFDEAESFTGGASSAFPETPSPQYPFFEHSFLGMPRDAANGAATSAAQHRLPAHGPLVPSVVHAGVAVRPAPPLAISLFETLDMGIKSHDEQSSSSGGSSCRKQAFCEDEPLDLGELEFESESRAFWPFPAATPSPQELPCATPSPRCSDAGALRVAWRCAIGGA